MRGSGTCPECKTPLRRNQFRVQLFEDSVIEKEIDIRKRIMKEYVFSSVYLRIVALIMPIVRICCNNLKACNKLFEKDSVMATCCHLTGTCIIFSLKTLFNIVEERFKKLLNFDVSAV